MKKILTNNNTLSAERVELDVRRPYGVLRPHGKMWGMDVFSWNNPSIEDVQNTLLSFPAPILLVVDSELNAPIFSQRGQDIEHVYETILYSTAISNEAIALPSLNVALKKLKDARLNKGIILIVTKEDEESVVLEELNFFLKIEQA